MTILCAPQEMEFLRDSQEASLGAGGRADEVFPARDGEKDYKKALFFCLFLFYSFILFVYF